MTNLQNYLRETVAQEDSRMAIQEEWKKWIKDEKVRYFVTITERESRFTRNSEAQKQATIRKFNELLYFVNSTLFRKRFERGEEFLDGFFVVETQKSGHPHVHCLIKNDLPFEKIRDAFCKQLDPKLRGKEKFKSLSMEGFDLQEVEQTDESYERLTQYLLKENTEYSPMGPDGFQMAMC